jgi:hypothetical protein
MIDLITPERGKQLSREGAKARRREGAKENTAMMTALKRFLRLFSSASFAPSCDNCFATTR